MSAPDVIYVPNTTSPEHLINDDAFTAYVRLDKVKELIEAERQIWIEQQKDSEIDLNIVALDVVEGQLEGLE